MKKNKILFWIFTGILTLLLGTGSVFDAISAPEAIENVTGLGYPAYIIPFLGVAKLAGLIAIPIPGYYRIKEWAYAGLTFDLVGATYSLIATGEPAKHWLPMLIGFGLIAGSYIYYHKISKAA